MLAVRAPRDRGLAGLLDLAPDELTVVWTIVAATIDPSLVALLPDLGPRAGRTGISLAQAAALLDVAPDRARPALPRTLTLPAISSTGR